MSLGSPTSSVVDLTVSFPSITVASTFGFATVAVRVYSPAASTTSSGSVVVIPSSAISSKPSTVYSTFGNSSFMNIS